MMDASQVYQPEADTYLLLKVAYAEVKLGDHVLEIGTGSGFIAAELLRIADVVATDINPHAVSCAKEKGIDVIRADLLSGIRGTFNLIVFNPPYLPTREDERINDWLEHALDGGATGRVVIERFAKDVGCVLAPEGRMLLLISSLTDLSEVTEIFARSGFITTIVAQRAIFDEELYVLRLVRRN